MKPKERVINAIERRKIDRIPLDGWFRPEYWIMLQRHFKVKDNESVMKRLGIDIRVVSMDPPRGYKPAYVFSPQKLSKDFESFYATVFDEWGIEREAGVTDEYWHFKHHPLEHMELEEYEFPDLDAPGRFDRAKQLVKKWDGEYATAGYALYGLFEHAWSLRGFRNFIRDLYVNPKFVNTLLDRLLKWKIEQGKRLIELGVDIIEVGDDLGSQIGLILSPSLIRKYLIPRYQRWLKNLKKAGAYVFFHSCGKIEDVIPDLIEAGVEILNPIQPECMDPANLKKLYGDKLTFHGTVSIQETLPFGTVNDVKNEVVTRIKTLGYNGGLILAPSHTVDKHVPLENILALYETAKRIPQ